MLNLILAVILLLKFTGNISKAGSSARHQ